MSETCEMIKFFEYLSWQEIQRPELACIYHIPNEGTRSIRRGRIMKQKGVRAGIPDVCVPIARGEWHSLFLEFKVKSGKLSPVQVKMCKLLHAHGHCVRVAWSADEAIEILEKYLLTNANK